MQLQQAVALVQAKFAAESQEKLDDPVHDQYHGAFDRYPLVMEVAVQAFADQVIQQNYEARKKAAIAQAQKRAADAQANGETPEVAEGEASAGEGAAETGELPDRSS
ncbi:MAG: hypothetical protein AAGA57_06025 [Planctomycetota bacterium]